MKNTVFAFISAMLLMSSCGSRDEAVSQSQIDAKVDSLVGARMEEINRQAMEDLDRRKAIEVKAKADSIVQARLAGE